MNTEKTFNEKSEETLQKVLEPSKLVHVCIEEKLSPLHTAYQLEKELLNL